MSLANPDFVKPDSIEKPPLYAAQIVCCCQRRLGIVEVRGVNSAKCECGRTFTMMRGSEPEPAPSYPKADES